jgi:hypothetical protein
MTTIRLATKGCPATACPSKYESRIIYWNHSCGSKVYLDRYANVHCYNCNIEWKILYSRFKCEYHKIYESPRPYANLCGLARNIAALSTMEFDNVRKDISSFTRQEFSDFLESVVEILLS